MLLQHDFNVLCTFGFTFCFSSQFNSAFFARRRTKTNKVLGFSVWLIFFLLSQQNVFFSGRLLYQSQHLLRPHKRRRFIFMRINAKKNMLYWIEDWFGTNDFDHWLKHHRGQQWNVWKRLFWCGLRVFHSVSFFFSTNKCLRYIMNASIAKRKQFYCTFDYFIYTFR